MSQRKYQFCLLTSSKKSTSSKKHLIREKEIVQKSIFPNPLLKIFSFPLKSSRFYNHKKTTSNMKKRKIKGSKNKNKAKI